MKSVARTLELSIASYSPCTPEEKQLERRRSIEETPNPIKRAVTIALDDVARDKPGVARWMLDRIARANGMQYLGHGADSSVYRQGDEVVKVYRRTAIVSTREREQFAELSSERVELAQVFLGRICVPQAYGVERHPFGGYTVAVARQQYIAGRPLNLFELSTTNLNHEAVARHLASDESAAERLIGFLDGATLLHEQHGLMPDLNGADNFRILSDGSSLAFIDPCPISQADNPWIYDILLRQADIVRDFVERGA